MDSPSQNKSELHFLYLEKLSETERIQYLWELDDATLWALFRRDCAEALVVLFRKYHRQVVVLVYKKMNDRRPVRLVEVQDAFGEFLERILAGRYHHEELRKNFMAFSIHHLSFLVKTRLKLIANSRMDGLEAGNLNDKKVNHHLQIETAIDFHQVIDFIPKVSNRVYRMVLYLIFVMEYNSYDLTHVFGQRAKAYDKRSRAMKAFRKLLEKEGLLEELRQKL